MPKVYAAGDQVTASDINAIVKTTGLYAVDAVGTDAYAITVSPVCGAYADGDVFRFRAGTANTGAATLAVSGLTAKAIVKNYNVALATGDILAGQMVTVQYDGPNDSFQMISPASGPVSAAGSGSYSGTGTNATVNSDDTIVCGFQPSVIELNFYIQGHDAATSSAHYKAKAGIATYSGTTLNGILDLNAGVDQGTSEGLAIGAFLLNYTDLTSSTAITAGEAAGSGAVRLTITIASVSSTGFVIRRAKTADETNASTARTTYTWKAFR